VKFCDPEVLGIYRLAKGLVNSQEELCFLKLVTCLVSLLVISRFPYVVSLDVSFIVVVVVVIIIIIIIIMFIYCNRVVTRWQWLLYM